MDTDERVYRWESYPEYEAAMQYGRCLGRILTSMRKKERKQARKPLVMLAIGMANGIAGAHAECPADRSLPRADREQFRSVGLKAVAATRDCLLDVRRRQAASAPDLAAAMELLERVEHGLRTRPIPE